MRLIRRINVFAFDLCVEQMPMNANDSEIERDKTIECDAYETIAFQVKYAKYPTPEI